MLYQKVLYSTEHYSKLFSAIPSPVTLTGDVCFIPFSPLIIITLFLPAIVFGQFKNVQGNIGAEFEQQNYIYSSSKNDLSRFHQVFNIFSNGYIIHPNLAEFSLNTRFRNINSNTSTNLGNLNQHDTYFNFYDANVEIFKSTKYPFTLYAKQDVNTNEVTNPIISNYSSKLLSTNFGGRFSNQFGEQYPRLILSYDNFSSRKLNTVVPNEMKSQNYQASVDGVIGKKTTWDLEVHQNNRRDVVNNLFYSTRAVQLHTSSLFSSTNQLSTNFSLNQENYNRTIYLSSMWHKQFDETSANQLSLQLRRFSYLNMRTYTYQISDQYNMPLIEEWRGLAVVSHTEATGTGSRSSSLAYAVLNDHNFDFGESNMLSQITYQRSVYTSILHSFEHLTSGALRFTQLPFGIVQIGEQFKFRKMIGALNRSNINNSTSFSVESEIFRHCTLQGNSTLSYSQDLGYQNSVIKNYTSFVDIQYTLRSFVEMFVNINYALNAISTVAYSNSTDRYSVMLTLPELLPNFNIQSRASIMQDRDKITENINYEVNASYNLRAVAFTLRYTGYQYHQFTRSDFYLTVTRPFDFEFEQ